MLQVELSL